MKKARLKQVVAQEKCLTCDICCRFADEESEFCPHLSGADLAALYSAGLDKSAVRKNRFKLVRYKNFYCCPCFVPEKNKCAFYSFRPLECQIYPFLLAEKNNKFFLALDKQCPLVNEAFISDNAAYIDYLKKIILSPQLKELLAKADFIFADYSQNKEVLYIEELNFNL